MHDESDMDGQPEARVYAFDGEQAERAERVVPADGDPAVEEWYAAQRARAWGNRPTYRAVWVTPRMLAPRRGARWIGIAVLLALLVLLFVKPLVALATIALAIVGTVVLVGIVAAGTLLLAARMVLGARHR